MEVALHGRGFPRALRGKQPIKLTVCMAFTFRWSGKHTPSKLVGQTEEESVLLILVSLRYAQINTSAQQERNPGAMTCVGPHYIRVKNIQAKPSFRWGTSCDDWMSPPGSVTGQFGIMTWRNICIRND
ncbi:hypothetical protein BsWGS_04515 [Bradybaena similaris]